MALKWPKNGQIFNRILYKKYKYLDKKFESQKGYSNFQKQKWIKNGLKKGPQSEIIQKYFFTRPQK